MRTIAIYNQAGGVGKTTCTRDIGYELASRGQRVLLIDADAQGSLGDFLGFDPHKVKSDKIFWTPMFSEQKGIPSHLEHKFGFSIGLANHTLEAGAIMLFQLGVKLRLYKQLLPLQPDYDWILIDCPPSSSEITSQVLMACDEILIPVQTEDKAVAGLESIQREIVRANDRRDLIRPPLKVTGVIPTLFDSRIGLHLRYLEDIQKISQNMGCPVFEPVRRLAAAAEACNAREPLKQYFPKSPLVDVFSQITDVLMKG